MKYFLEMISCLQRQGGTIKKDRTKDTKITDITPLLEECVPFVFYQDDTSNVLDSNCLAETLVGGFDLPFKTISIEIMGTHLAKGKDTSLYSKCILLHEYGPNEYGVLLLLELEGESYVMGGSATKMSRDFQQVILSCINRINSEQVGTEQVRHKVKMGTGKDKHFHTFRQVTYVYPKKQSIPESFKNKKIDWSHRWFSRGHWRKLENPSSLGKDRQGLYQIAGSTWVTESVKGPEGRPLINKVHVVKD